MGKREWSDVFGALHSPTLGTRRVGLLHSLLCCRRTVIVGKRPSGSARRLEEKEENTLRYESGTGGLWSISLDGKLRCFVVKLFFLLFRQFNWPLKVYERNLVSKIRIFR